MCPLNILLIFSNFFVFNLVAFSTIQRGDEFVEPTTVSTEIFLLPTTTAEGKIATSVHKPTHKFGHEKSKKEQVLDEKSLQSKIKRLKKLKSEVRALSNQLKLDRRLKDEVISIHLTPPSETNKGSLSKWKNRIRNRVKSILKRLEKLEKAMKLRKSEVRQAKKKLKKSTLLTTPILIGPTTLALPTRPTRRSRISTKLVPVHITRTTMEPSRMTTNLMHYAFNQAKNKSLSGDLGGNCNSHHECKPGLCCHKISHPNDTTTGECVRHAKKELDHCDHSCACMHGLQCFRDTSGVGSFMKLAYCKKASPDDAMSGVYLNEKDRLFDFTGSL